MVSLSILYPVLADQFPIPRMINDTMEPFMPVVHAAVWIFLGVLGILAFYLIFEVFGAWHKPSRRLRNAGRHPGPSGAGQTATGTSCPDPARQSGSPVDGYVNQSEQPVEPTVSSLTVSTLKWLNRYFAWRLSLKRLAITLLFLAMFGWLNLAPASNSTSWGWPVHIIQKQENCLRSVPPSFFHADLLLGVTLDALFALAMLVLILFLQIPRPAVPFPTEPGGPAAHPPGPPQSPPARL